MNVQNYIPGKDSAQAGDGTVTMTEIAIAQSLAQVVREKALGLRLSVKPSGCSGYMYVLDFVRDAQPGDRLFRFGELALYVDEKSLPVVNGTRIDYVHEGLNSLYKFHNPNATGECGCGESFTVN